MIIEHFWRTVDRSFCTTHHSSSFHVSTSLLFTMARGTTFENWNTLIYLSSLYNHNFLETRLCWQVTYRHISTESCDQWPPQHPISVPLRCPVNSRLWWRRGRVGNWHTRATSDSLFFLVHTETIVIRVCQQQVFDICRVHLRRRNLGAGFWRRLSCCSRRGV